MTAASDRGEFSLGWKVLLAGVLGVACGASPLPFNIIGLTVEPLMKEFDWTVTQTVLPITIFGIVASLLAPYFGSLADRHGVRKVALFSLLAFGLSFAAVALTPDAKTNATLYIYYAFWTLIGIVGIGSTPVSWSRAINLWFFKSRGLALGILLLGTSLAAMTVPHLADWAIKNYGWRNMFLIVALLPLLIALPIGYLLFREPEKHERPAGITNQDGNLTGLTRGAAIRNYRFWLIWLSIAIISIAFGGAFVNMVKILSDRGLDSGTAAWVMTTLGIGIFMGRIITGALLDRFWQGFVGFPLLCLPAIACFLLLGESISFPVAALAGFLLGFAAGAESDLIAYLAGRYFGMAHYGKIYGLLYMPFGFFSALSPIIYAQVRDRTGSYDLILAAAIFVFVIGGALLLLLGRYPEDFEADAPEPALAT